MTGRMNAVERNTVTSYRPMFTFPSGETVGNAQRFATEAEAEASGRARWRAWSMPVEYSVEASTDPVNYRRAEGRDIML